MGGGSCVFCSSAMSQANDYLFARKRESFFFGFVFRYALARIFFGFFFVLLAAFWCFLVLFVFLSR